MQLNNFLKKILLLFLVWKIYLFIFLFVALKYIPISNLDKFLGGGLANYLKFPSIFSWANFDGEHYLSIAIFGYKGLEQAFFPIYPLLIHLLSQPNTNNLPQSLLTSTIVGILISNSIFFIALVLLWKIIRLDFSEKIATWTVVVLLIFPTSFYFGAVYNEALFLCLSLASFYFARKGNFLMASIFGIIASATRIFGFLLLPALFLEAWQQRVSFKKYFWIILIPLGLLGYMVYQWITVGDPLAFYRLQKIVGEQHQSGLTLLPQVYFRYIKILLTVNPLDPIYQTMVLEFLVGILFFMVPIYAHFNKKMRLSYVFYALAGFLLPTIQGSLSSVPRYVIVFFPSFIAMAIFVNNLPRLAKVAIVTFSAGWLAIETMFFVRGYWIA